MPSSPWNPDFLSGAPTAEDFMLRAVALAEQGRFSAAPNPCVGAVVTLARDGVETVVAQGFHTAYGKPHAEVEAIADARARGVDLSRATLYVTLEPCNHQGKTPPCTRAVLEAGIPRVVVGAADPNRTVDGGGMAFLRGQGVAVESGVAEQACLDLIADFRVWQETARPYVLLKLAATLDGRIATRTGHSRWISGAAARAEVHALRAGVQAVLVGGNTFYEDDPQLTHRGVPDGLRAHAPQPVAVVATGRLPAADADFHLLRQRPEQTVFFTDEGRAASSRAEALRGLGCRVWGLPAHPAGAPGLALHVGLERLRRELGCLYVLCEGGGGLGLGLLESGLADELRLYLAPKVLADPEARGLFSGRAPLAMDEALGLRMAGCRPCGEDIRITCRPKERN
jgi:diaminohydroxyphosphoribosylaminopyrimidine deaminase/5-amino-6-(5-phosphoribosylamino)uracil reductase